MHCPVFEYRVSHGYVDQDVSSIGKLQDWKISGLSGIVIFFNAASKEGANFTC